MKAIVPVLLVSMSLVSGSLLAGDEVQSRVSLSDKERIDLLIQQNQSLTEQNAKLHAQCELPKTKEAAFAACMQAAKGQTSAMAAESVGGHCDQLLKK